MKAKEIGLIVAGLILGGSAIAYGPSQVLFSTYWFTKPEFIWLAIGTRLYIMGDGWYFVVYFDKWAFLYVLGYAIHGFFKALSPKVLALFKKLKK